jgi:hypothetical protein
MSEIIARAAMCDDALFVAGLRKALTEEAILACADPSTCINSACKQQQRSLALISYVLLNPYPIGKTALCERHALFIAKFHRQFCPHTAQPFFIFYHLWFMCFVFYDIFRERCDDVNNTNRKTTTLVQIISFSRTHAHKILCGCCATLF